MPPTTTPGQRAYERDCAHEPRYHDGTPRKTWDALLATSRAMWESHPIARDDRAALDQRGHAHASVLRSWTGINPIRKAEEAKDNARTAEDAAMWRAVISLLLDS